VSRLEWILSVYSVVSTVLIIYYQTVYYDLVDDVIKAFSKEINK